VQLISVRRPCPSAVYHGDAWSWSRTFRILNHCSTGFKPLYVRSLLCRTLGGPHSRSARGSEENNYPACNRTPLIQSLAIYFTRRHPGGNGAHSCRGTCCFEWVFFLSSSCYCWGKASNKFMAVYLTWLLSLQLKLALCYITPPHEDMEEKSYRSRHPWPRNWLKGRQVVSLTPLLLYPSRK
jgi:hypothetical protein